MSQAQNHPLIKRFPLTGKHQTSAGEMPSPYLVYDGQVMFIGATADYTAVRDLLSNEALTPLRTTDGKALMAVWICDFTEASLGPHTELQFSIFAAYQPVPDLPSHPLSIFQAVAANAATRMVCHRLWNNSARVVAYNREALRLDANLVQSVIASHNGTIMFGFTVGGESLVEGAIQFPKRQQNAVIVDLMKLMGVIPFIRSAFHPVLNLTVVNTHSADYPHNAEAQTYTARESVTLKYFDAAQDSLHIHTAPYNALSLTPTFAQRLTGVKFVYLDPQQV